jgi:rhamnulokinase
MTGRKIERLHVVGGGSQNDMLNRFTADAAGIPVIAGPVEATVVGNALVQAMALGQVSSLELARKIIGNSFQLKEYLPENTRKWDEAYKSAPFNF